MEPQFSIPSSGYTGFGSVRAAEEILKAATDANLAASQPAALMIHQDPNHPRVLYGIPTTKTSTSFLNLTWFKNNELRANFRAILLMKEIVIPSASRMVIDVEKIHHPVHRHCVKLSWTEDCFIPINDRPPSADNTPAQ